MHDAAFGMLRADFFEKGGIFVWVGCGRGRGFFGSLVIIIQICDRKRAIKMIGINYAVRFFCRIEREKTKPMAFSVANMQNMGLLIPISMCGHKQDSVFFIRRHDKETYGYSIF